MLISLQIKDYALIENLSIEFGKGLNIITGETGAGKSIIIGALGLLLGERASTESIRKGAVKSFVEGLFEIKSNNKVIKLLEENEIEVFPELILRRELSIKGTNRCFINDTPVSLAVFKEIGDLLIDIHGQHQHQSLLKVETHIDFLDDYGGYTQQLNDYIKSRKSLLNSINELKDIKSREESIRQKKEIYEFQIKEIDTVAPIVNEDIEIESELNILENAELLKQLSEQIYLGLYEDENAAFTILGRIRKIFEELIDIDKSLVEKEKEFNDALAMIEDIARSIRKYKDKVELDPEKLNLLRERLLSITRLKKKYGGSISSTLEYRNKIGEEFDLADNFSLRIEELKKEIETRREITALAAKTLHKEREKTASLINSLMNEELSKLGMPDAEFFTKITFMEAADKEYSLKINDLIVGFDKKGIDEVEFYIKTNRGEDSKQLIKTASGGEISRVMLALKTVLAKNEKLPLMIFDEIDTGVSGRIAQKVGYALTELAGFYQIIAITHLPQIAACGNQHYVVEKGLNDERVTSNIRLLNENERVEELAKLISGEVLTESSLSSARELLEFKIN